MNKKVVLGLGATVVFGSGAVIGSKLIKNQINECYIFLHSFVLDFVLDRYSSDIFDKVQETFEQEKKHHPLRFVKNMNRLKSIATNMYSETEFSETLKDIIGDIDTELLVFMWREEINKNMEELRHE